jgi:hypothetical protein
VKVGRRNGVQLTPFMNPKICPKCLGPAAVVFGARRYCQACALELRDYVDRARGAQREEEPAA